MNLAASQSCLVVEWIGFATLRQNLKESGFA